MIIKGSFPYVNIYVFENTIIIENMNILRTPCHFIMIPKRQRVKR